MQLRADGLEPHLAKGLGRCYTVFGDEPLLVQEAVDRIRVAARAAGFTERSVFSVERGFDWSVLLGANQSMSLFGDRQLIELRIPTGKPGKEGGEALRTLAASDNPDSMLLITLPRLDAATQKAAWFSALAQRGVSVRTCRTGSRSAWPRKGKSSPPAKRVAERCNSSQKKSKAICWRHIRKSRNWVCCIRAAC